MAVLDLIEHFAQILTELYSVNFVHHGRVSIYAYDHHGLIDHYGQYG
jgi:hypothetical protein